MAGRPPSPSRAYAACGEPWNSSPPRRRHALTAAGPGHCRAPVPRRVNCHAGSRGESSAYIAISRRRAIGAAPPPGDAKRFSTAPRRCCWLSWCAAREGRSAQWRAVASRQTEQRRVAPAGPLLPGERGTARGAGRMSRSRGGGSGFPLRTKPATEHFRHRMIEAFERAFRDGERIRPQVVRCRKCSVAVTVSGGRSHVAASTSLSHLRDERN